MAGRALLPVEQVGIFRGVRDAEAAARVRAGGAGASPRSPPSW
jgi:hypothetical protein